MNIKTLCAHPIDELERMTDEELRVALTPFLIEYVLDPEEIEEEKVKKPKKAKKGKSSMLELSAILAANGLEMPKELKKL